MADDRDRSDFATVAARGVKPNAVRVLNQRAIAMTIAMQPGLSNAKLAIASDLAPQTVSSVLDDLDAMGIIYWGEAQRGKRGQPAKPVFLNPDGAFCIGAEIGWESMEVVLVQLDSTLLGDPIRVSYSYPDANTVFAELGRAAATMVGRLSNDQRQRLVGLGLAMPGHLGDSQALRAAPDHQAELWAAIDPVAAAAAATHLPVSLFNDGAAACFAEAAAAGADRRSSYAFLLVDTFVAAGLVAEGRLWEGPNRDSANLGAMLVTDNSGTPRFVHQIASLDALEKRMVSVGGSLKDAFANPPNASVTEELDEWLSESGSAFAQALVNTSSVIAFDAAVIDGALPVHLRDRLVAETRRHIHQVPSLGDWRPEILAGHLGRSGAALGAGQIPIYRKYFSRRVEHVGL